MAVFHILCQLIIALGILNVWLLRAGGGTSYRGGDARNLKDEFAVYGLPTWTIFAVGCLKVGSALALLVGVFFPVLVQPASIVMAVLMVGAILMHAKVKDPPKKYLPAAIVLVLALLLIFTR
ncbi:MAG: putative membrane protein YphA (DoxX/SURF4 family) [Verrucomicrobiales bacterium]|jgi:uncharacterized membrane protein YphA (DoxX/SURF4 family)